MTQRFSFLLHRGALLPFLLGMMIVPPILMADNPTALAELPPGAYQQLRSNAPEALKIKVLKVHTQGLKPNTLKVEVQAKVLSVVRSASKLKPGSMIRIVYEVDKQVPQRVGPRAVPVLKAGLLYAAFLAQDDKIYTPAAYGDSFDLMSSTESAFRER
jgi:hypothetical protein